MNYLFPLTLAGLLASSLLAPRATAQPTPPTAGRLSYEGTRRLDVDKVKITSVTVNGQPVRLEDLGEQVHLPESIGAEKSLLFSGAYAKEERNRNLVVRGAEARPSGAPTPLPKGVVIAFLETKYLNLTDRTATTVTTLTATNTEYVSPAAPIPTPPAGWQDLPQTKRIAGYLCHKVTVPFKKETYTLWVTTELPFSYSPVRELTPTQGVVLALSSDQEAYTATKLTAEAVPEAAVRPSPQAQPITEAELKELRAKASADQRQRLMEQYSGGAR